MAKVSEDDVDDMIFHDRADEALRLALQEGWRDLARTAARVVVCSGSYSEKSRELALREFPGIDR